MRSLLFGLLVVPAGGCFAYHRASPDRGAPEFIPASAWELEVTDELRELQAITPEHVAKRVTHIEIRAGGLLRLYEQPASENAGAPDSFAELDGFSPNGSFVTAHRLARVRAESELDERFAPRSRHGLNRADPSEETLLLAGDGILVGIPAPAPDACGIVLHLPAIFGNPYEARVLEHLERCGWAIAHVETETWIAGPNDLARSCAFKARIRRQIDLETTMAGANATAREDYLEVIHEARRRAEAEIPIPDTGFEVREGTDPDAVGSLIAEAVDRHLIEHANAARAVIDYLDEHRPDLTGKPVIVMGFSAGALLAPTVAARLGGRVSAVVMVGGGASLVDVARGSTFSDGGIDLIPPSGPAPSAQLLDRVCAAYRARSRVDPYRAARALLNVPVLHIYGRSDTWIPTSTAETLLARLGGPDTLVFSGGHRALFYFLPGQRGFIARWIDDAVWGVHAPP